MVSQTLLSELNVILQEDYDTNLTLTELTELANNLVGVFELLAKMDFDYLNENEKQKREIYD